MTAPSRERTRSVCPECLGQVDAWRVHEGDDVFLEKTCPAHGAFRTVIWRGSPAWHGWVGAGAEPAGSPGPSCPADCGPCANHASGTCCALLEVTRRCNLSCPVCFASAGGASGDPSAEVLERALRALLAQAGPCNLQLSGGEPTVRDDLPSLVALARRVGFPFVQLNSNGLRLGRDPAFVRALREAGLGCVFMQFDGLEDGVHRRLRGANLRAAKAAAVARCAEAGLGVVLVPTVVPGVNDDAIGEIVEQALRWGPAVRGVHVQPVSWFGRYPRAPRDEDRITLPEVVTRIERQTGGLVTAAALRPAVSEHPACSFHGSFRRLPGLRLAEVAPPRGPGCCSRPGGAARAASQAVAGRWTLEAGAPSASLDPATASLDAFLASTREASFTISGMAFQDAWTLDLGRLRRCHLHVAAAPGRLVPFCAFNLTSRDGRPLHRAGMEP